MRRLFSIAAALIFLLASCDKNNDNPESANNGETAYLVVNVNSNGSPVPKGVKVVTNPFTIIAETDAFGQAQFENIPLGYYTVYSYIPMFGSGKTFTEVKKGVNDINVNLIPGVLVEPAVYIVSPDQGQGFAVGDQIEFIAYVSDNNNEPEILQIQWESDVDGILGTSVADTSGKVTFSIATLSAAEHYIKLTATNTLNISSSDSVWINTLSPRAVTLSLQQDAFYNVTLNWTTNKTEIDRFEVYKYTDQYYNAQLLATLNNQTFTYSDYAVPFCDSVHYYVKAYSPDDYFSISNKASAQGTPYFNISIDQAFYYPATDMVYAFSGGTVMGIDYKTANILSEYTLVSNIGDIFIADNGFGHELYAPCQDGWLYIYNLSTMQQKEMINVGVPVECVISDGNGLLFTSVSPSPWWEDPLRVYDRNTLFFVDGGGDFDDCRLRLLPSGNEIIEITRSVSPIDMDYYRFDANGFIVQHEDDSYHGDHPLDPDIYKVAPAQDYLITAISGSVYTANEDMLYVGSLPGSTDYFADFEFSSDASIIYAGMSNRKSIGVFEYPSLAKIDEIPSKGYAIYLFKHDETLIMISSPEPYNTYSNPWSFGVETFIVE